MLLILDDDDVALINQLKIIKKKTEELKIVDLKGNVSSSSFRATELRRDPTLIWMIFIDLVLLVLFVRWICFSIFFSMWSIEQTSPFILIYLKMITFGGWEKIILCFLHVWVRRRGVFAFPYSTIFASWLENFFVEKSKKFSLFKK